MVRGNSHTPSLFPSLASDRKLGEGLGTRIPHPFLQTDAPKANIVGSSVTLLSMLIRS